MRIQLGCGHKPWPGWINVDSDRVGDCADLIADLKSIPLADDYADTVAAIHVIEHFYQWEAVDVLKEWRRILKPGGTLILELPCLDKVIQYFVKCATQSEPVFAQMSWWALWGDPRYQNVQMTHKWGYTKEMLRDVLQQAGFHTITITNPRYHIKQRDMRALAVK